MPERIVGSEAGTLGQEPPPALPESLVYLRGASRLAVDAVLGVTGIVESMHRNIAGLAPVVGAAPPGRTRGITGMVYGGVRGVTRVVGLGLDAALAKLSPLLRGRHGSPRGDAVRAALNGVLGDYLAASGNPLAIGMQLRQQGHALTLEREALGREIEAPQGRVLLLVHGLCMNDLQWRRERHDHGEALARELGLTPLYLYYNSGEHISKNGRALAHLLETLLREWPQELRELTILGHSMGGLVARSAVHYARRSRLEWPRRLVKLVFLGSPHHGAPLERAGNWVDVLVGISPYTAPFARLGKIRSAGVKDLRYGNLLDTDWQGQAKEHTHDPRTPLPLPRGVRCYTLAASRETDTQMPERRLPGDGLVPVASALGEHHDPTRSLHFATAHRRVVRGCGHLELLHHREVYEHIRAWLEEA
ncbi:hypothetical protein BAC1_00869 [uncultured bacterium]|nr:MAG: alpha/beta hydrolase [Burkholderiales bacterium]CAG1065290.1 hypothetical protein BAC1_00869 [uncultured bacterium]